MIVSWYKGKGDRTNVEIMVEHTFKHGWKNICRDISRVRRVTKGD